MSKQAWKTWLHLCIVKYVKMVRWKDFDGYTFVQYRRDDAVSDNRAAADDISQVQKNPSTHKNAY